MAKRTFRIGGKVEFSVNKENRKGTIVHRSYKNETVTVKSKRKCYELDMNNFA